MRISHRPMSNRVTDTSLLRYTGPNKDTRTHIHIVIYFETVPGRCMWIKPTLPACTVRALSLSVSRSVCLPSSRSLFQSGPLSFFCPFCCICLLYTASRYTTIWKPCLDFDDESYCVCNVLMSAQHDFHMYACRVYAHRTNTDTHRSIQSQHTHSQSHAHTLFGQRKTKKLKIELYWRFAGLYNTVQMKTVSSACSSIFSDE